MDRVACLVVLTNEHYLPLLYILALQGKDDVVGFFADKVTRGSSGSAVIVAALPPDASCGKPVLKSSQTRANWLPRTAAMIRSQCWIPAISDGRKSAIIPYLRTMTSPPSQRGDAFGASSPCVRT